MSQPASKMYKLRPIFQLPENLSVKHCLYKMKTITETLNGNRVSITETSDEVIVTPSLSDKSSSNETKPIPDDVLDLDNRWRAIEDRLAALQSEIRKQTTSTTVITVASSNLRPEPLVGSFQDLVITASPARPPYSLQLILHLLQQAGVKVFASTHIHSSVGGSLPSDLVSFLSSHPSVQRSQAQLAVTLIWKKSDNDEASLMISPSAQISAILGESNIARYLSRVVSLFSHGNASAASVADELLDLTDFGAPLGICGSKRERPAALQVLEKKLASTMLSGTAQPSLVDAVLYSAILNAKLDLQKDLGKNGKNWLERCRTFLADKSSNDPVDSACQHMTRPQLESLLRNLDIKFSILEHPEVFTVAAMMEYVTVLPGFHAKNLFVKDKKKGTLYLVTARHDVAINLNQLAKLVGCKELRFAEENILYEKLGVKQGCVTPFALINDVNHDVTFVIDSKLVESDEAVLNCHPLSNAATLNLTARDFKKFVKRTGHQMLTVHF